MHSSKHALYQCKDSATTKTKTSPSISTVKSDRSHPLALKLTSMVWLCLHYRLPLREGDHIHTICLSEIVSGLRCLLYYAWESPGKILLRMAQSTRGTMPATSQDGRSVSISAIPQVPLSGTEIIFKVILLPKPLQNQKWQQKFLQYFVDCPTCLSNEQKQGT